MSILLFKTNRPSFLQRQQIALAYIRKQKKLAIKHKRTYMNGSALGLSHKQLLARIDLIERAILRAGSGDVLADNLCECNYFYSMFTRIKPQHIPPQLPFYVYSTSAEDAFWYELGNTLVKIDDCYFVYSEKLTHIEVDGHTVNVAIRTTTLAHFPLLKSAIDNY